jgi:hypothetical protein
MKMPKQAWTTRFKDVDADCLFCALANGARPAERKYSRFKVHVLEFAKAE